MKKIGITGGIGSGKTIICEVFKILGISVFHADAAARVLQDTDPSIREGLIDLFGDSIYFKEGRLDRKKLAGIIFNDSDLINVVNHLVHPVVKECFQKWIISHVKEEYILYEAAILFETGSHRDFDHTILVVADEKTRIKRVVKRDAITPELVVERIRNQMPDKEKILLADYIINNDEKHLIIPQILELDKIFKAKWRNLVNG